MNRSKIGLITIGQSPRYDIIGEMSILLRGNLEIIQRGALDYRSESEIKNLQPDADDFPMVTKLCDGSSIVVGKKKVTPLIQEPVDNLGAEGVDVSIILCTEPISGIKSRGILISPWAVVINTVKAIMDAGTIGVMIPLDEQQERAIGKWNSTSFNVVTAMIPPYHIDFPCEEIVSEFKEADVKLIVLDCIGYSMTLKDRLQNLTELPVILPRSLVAAVISELVG